MTDTLIDIAIADRRPAEVIRWYDERKPRSVGWIDDDKIAQAVADAYPDRALELIVEPRAVGSNPKVATPQP